MMLFLVVLVIIVSKIKLILSFIVECVCVGFLVCLVASDFLFNRLMTKPIRLDSEERLFSNLQQTAFNKSVKNCVFNKLAFCA